MADSSTQIGNLALSAMGARASISNLTENSAEARAISLWYTPCLNAVLRSCHWNFARQQQALALLQDATATPPGKVPSPWLYEYSYPQDCVLARYIMPVVDNLPAAAPGASSMPFYIGQPQPFLVANDQDASNNDIRVMLTNVATAVLVYTKRVTNVALFDDDFTMAFAKYLGAHICIALSGDKKLATMLVQTAQDMANKAQKTNGNESITVIDNIPDWMRVRGYASDWAYPPGSVFFTSPQALGLIS